MMMSFRVGCAGGMDTNTKYEYELEDVPENYCAFQIELKGLRGGHSGMDINLGRANANLLMNRIIFELYDNADVRISEIEGGSLRNAIPRESFGVIVMNENAQTEIKEVFEAILEDLKVEYSNIEPSLEANLSPVDNPSQMVSKSDMAVILNVIYSTPNGVWKMSDKIPGLVESSTSLAKVEIKDGFFTTQSLQRSMIESGKRDVSNAMRSNYEQIGAEVIQDGDYPGWEPNPSSRILVVMREKYKEMFSEEPKVEACHAGLECGILGKHLPDCDMISFGPTIRHPHSPDEKVNIKSVHKFWNFFVKVIEDIPDKN